MSSSSSPPSPPPPTKRRRKGPCIHGAKQPYDCKKCPGKGICEHSKRRRACRKCAVAGKDYIAGHYDKSAKEGIAAIGWAATVAGDKPLREALWIYELRTPAEAVARKMVLLK